MTPFLVERTIARIERKETRLAIDGRWISVKTIKRSVERRAIVC